MHRLSFAIATALLTACAAPGPAELTDAAQRDESKTEMTQAAPEPVPQPMPADLAKPDLERAIAASGEKRRQELEVYNAPSGAQPALALRAPQSPVPHIAAPASAALPPVYREIANRERYAELQPNALQLTSEHPVSTFSIDVDTGSFSNVRRQLEQGLLPPANAVRTEEFINWFDYGYQPPASLATPFSVSTEIADAPWNADRKLMLIGLKGFEVAPAQIPAANLVFLVDTSGSMQSEDKLGLLKQSLIALAESMRPQDRVAIVAYAGSAGLVLPPTSGAEKQQIIAALDRLQAGGSTNGAAGIELAYQVAQQQFVANGVNRVILATDGDFNVGTVSVEALKSMIRNRRDSGIALTTLGFGRDNYNDELAERLADLGNGNHAYIDRIEEGRKVLVDELSSTLMTIATDVKIQVEFNPAVVAEYRLLGYENRALRREDFNNDKVDAGEIGAGHDVTALYELTLVDSASRRVEPLRYAANDLAVGQSDELGFLKLRYKPDANSASRLIEQPILRPATSAAASTRLQLAAAVAGFAEVLRGSGQLGDFSYRDLRALIDRAAENAVSEQVDTLRAMIARAEQLSAAHTAAVD